MDLVQQFYYVSPGHVLVGDGWTRRRRSQEIRTRGPNITNNNYKFITTVMGGTCHFENAINKFLFYRLLVALTFLRENLLKSIIENLNISMYDSNRRKEKK